MSNAAILPARAAAFAPPIPAPSPAMNTAGFGVRPHFSEARERYAQVRPREYVSGEQVLYLGRRYMLKVIPVDRKPAPARLRGNRLEVETANGMEDDIKGRLRAWYLVRGRDYLSRRIDALAKNLPWVDAPPSFRLLEMSRQWGKLLPVRRDHHQPSPGQSAAAVCRLCAHL
ncbi:YgjP-like metallopeptidase domain-containing protein [Sedimentitalea nanhaiensis]